MEVIPGVTFVGLVGGYPPLHMGWSSENVFTDKTTDPQPANAAVEAITYKVSPRYFQAAGTRLLSGLVVRSSGDPQLLAAAIRGQLRNLDPALPVFMQTWNQEMSGALFAPRMATLSLGVLGVMGGVLSITGIFGMAAYSVSRRRRELAIRIALGAARKELLGAALGRAARLLACGSAAGLILGILASRVLAAIVYQATPRDPLVLAGVVLAMAMLGLAAAWIPAQRTLSIDPMILLREE